MCVCCLVREVVLLDAQLLHPLQHLGVREGRVICIYIYIYIYICRAFVGFLLFNSLFQNFARISPGFHLNFNRMSPEVLWNFTIVSPENRIGAP